MPERDAGRPRTHDRFVAAAPATAHAASTNGRRGPVRRLASQTKASAGPGPANSAFRDAHAASVPKPPASATHTAVDPAGRGAEPASHAPVPHAPVSRTGRAKARTSA